MTEKLGVAVSSVELCLDLYHLDAPHQLYFGPLFLSADQGDGSKGNVSRKVPALLYIPLVMLEKQLDGLNGCLFVLNY